MGKKTMPSLEEIQRQMEKLQREPFQHLLARMMACAPDEEAIAAQAKKYPDRWAQTVTQMAKLAGYSDKLELGGELKVGKMSDAELEHQYEQAIEEEVQKRLAQQGHSHGKEHPAHDQQGPQGENGEGQHLEQIGREHPQDEDKQDPDHGQHGLPH